MTPPKRHIKVYEGTKVIYEGEDKRTYDKDYQRLTLFGLPIMDTVKLVAYLVMLVVFLVKTDGRLTKVEESQALLINMNKQFVEYQQNADAWHSSVLGTQFKNGKPLNDNIDMKRLKKNFIADTGDN